MSDTIRVGVVGTSWWADAMHLPSLKSHPRAELVAIAGRSAERAQALARKYDIAQVFTDYRAMIERAGLHALVISVPDDLHYAITIEALDARLHVVCEKPLALNAAQAKAMHERAEAARVKHMTYFTWRWMPQFRYIKQLVDDGYIGRCYHAHFNQLGGYARSHAYAWRFDGRRANGSLGDIGSHMIDLARWLVGDIARVSAHLATFVAHDETPVAANDSAILNVQFANSAHGQIHVSAVTHLGASGQQQRTMLAGALGTLIAERNALSESLHGVRHAEAQVNALTVPDEFWSDADRSRPYSVFETQSAGCRQFIDAIVEDRPITPSFYDGWQAQAVIEAAIEAHRTGRWIEVMRSA